ncbi:hypothetical protein C0Q70_06454 [Pomacea canaliculata]|uniref:AIG1-type G domain-containing protein n=1 Tax=Pomacea canaliculata TaxID=400727 RepID=A0A2T7PP14_POMCA|nr:hypothetical protein C0Q70_06454 [Pomacea canaliculata]
MCVWAQSFEISQETLRFLREEGFTSINLLRRLTPEEIEKSLQLPRRLPLAQCLALKEAVTKLVEDIVPMKLIQKVSEKSHETITHPLAQNTQMTCTMQEYCARNQTGGVRRLQEKVSTNQFTTQGTQIEQTEQTPAISALNNEEATSEREFNWCPRETHPSEANATQCQQTLQKDDQDTSLTAEGVGSSVFNSKMSVCAGETFRFLLVGKTGSGKSTTGNTILGGDYFTSDLRFDSVTGACQLKRSSRNGVTTEIMDSPGLFDTRSKHEEISTAIVQAVACMHPGPHAFLYTIKVGRFTKEDEDAYNRLIALFDRKLENYTIVIFTGGDELERSGMSMKQMFMKSPEYLTTLIKACKNRYVIFNNMTADKQPQVDLLLQKVREMIAANGGVLYTCPRYIKIGEGMEQEVTRRLEEVEKQHLKRRDFIQELEVKAKQAKDALAREREELQRKEQALQQALTENDERRKKELKNMNQRLEKKQITEDEKQHQTTTFLKKNEEERQQQTRKMEEIRKQKQTVLQKREKEIQEAAAKMKEEQRKLQEERRQFYEKEMWTLRGAIADKKETTLLNKLKLGAKQAINSVIDGIASLIPSHRR